jgi:predicted PurR-regulated permease PerM
MLSRSTGMTDTGRSRVALEIPWKTIWQLLIAAALVWCLLKLYRVLLVIVVAAILAVLLDPLVGWLERHGLSRTSATVLVSLGLLLAAGGFLWATWASLADQAQYVGSRFSEVEKQIRPHLPASIGQNLPSAAGKYAMPIAVSAASAVTFAVFVFVLTMYLLMDWRRTYQWVLAFVPRRDRPRFEATAVECSGLMFAYMKGNVITSVIATVCTLIALWILDVPAALLLAIIAGLSDFVPVIGFVISAIPAILLALSVSVATTLWVVAFYIAYNTVENYLISPWAYGSRMKMSDIAVLLAFAAGAELGGVIGALIALPLAAAYPTVERMWLRRKLPEETVEEHRDLMEGSPPDR